MTTRLDDGPEYEPDDPLTVILRPPSDHLGPPPGRYEAIRRTAARRRILRAAAGVGLACAAAALIALPLSLVTRETRETPAPPTVPLAPPTTSGRTAHPTPTPTPTPPATSTPSESPGRVSPRPDQRPGPADSTLAPSATPTSPRDEPSKRRAGTVTEPSRSQ
ncbi:hypothetical protein [Streptomyces sp. ME19-01-6]|uniref:hypothetical protein n=1 Tax=Streptomyces sp. ME19-01-6 TaxID=3028686 RepID=UPI0029BA4178|nr:hypothetical protein [Streptomyces sp. ME19-01-6]MDX3225684.1 hypothetical protein [Streptomyces sp. ME19-01-6]